MHVNYLVRNSCTDKNVCFVRCKIKKKKKVKYIYFCREGDILHHSQLDLKLFIFFLNVSILPLEPRHACLEAHVTS